MYNLEKELKFTIKGIKFIPIISDYGNDVYKITYYNNMLENGRVSYPLIKPNSHSKNILKINHQSMKEDISITLKKRGL